MEEDINERRSVGWRAPVGGHLQGGGHPWEQGRGGMLKGDGGL